MKQTLSADAALAAIQQRFLDLLKTGDSFQLEINYKDGNVVIKSTDYKHLTVDRKLTENHAK